MTANWEVALDRANEIRLKRAELRRLVREGECSLADVIDPQVATEYDEAVETCVVHVLLRFAMRVGPGRASTILRGLGEIRPGVRLGQMGPIRRGQLAYMLRDKGIGEPT